MLVTYMRDKKNIKSDQEKYLEHEKIINKLARRITKHAQSFQKSGVVCIQNTGHHARRGDWSQAIASANRLREHVDLLIQYPGTLPKSASFPRQISKSA